MPLIFLFTITDCDLHEKMKVQITKRKMILAEDMIKDTIPFYLS